MNDMEHEIEVMLGVQAGIITVLSALIATHPNHAQLQLAIARQCEHVAQSSLRPKLSDAGREAAETLCSSLQQIAAAPQESDPLSSLGFDWKNR